MDAESLQQLLVDNLQDLYDAERQLIKSLPKLAEAAESEQLSKGMNEHLDVTRKQAERLEKIFEMLEEKPKGKACKGMKGIIEEDEEHLAEEGPAGLVDAVLIAGGRKIETYEIVAYTGAMEVAQALGNQQVARLLRQTLVEEQRMDRKLAQLSARMLKQTKAAA